VTFEYRSAARAVLALAACGALWQAPPAAALQTTSATTTSTTTSGDKTSKDDTTTVTVKGRKKSENQVDRQIYDVSKTPDSQTANAAETLGKLPGVSVDPSGNVTLRGQNVRIFLNGRPSLMLSGDNRAQALQAMPSSYLGSVEIISNPGPQFDSGSSDPIINIVTKRKSPPGVFGSVTARANSTGRGQVSNWTSYTNGDLNVSAYGGDYGSVTTGRRGSDLEAFNLGALTDQTQSNGASLSHDKGIFLGASLEDDIGPNDVVTAGLNYNHGEGDYAGQGHTAIYDSTGQATDINSSSSLGHYMYGSQALTFGYTHYGQKPDETLKIDGSLSSSQNQSASQNDTTYALSSVATDVGTLADTKARDGDTRNARLNVDYNTPVGDDQVAVGGQVTHDDSRSQLTSFGPDAVGTSLLPETLLDDDFRYQQTVSAAYGTWQREFTDALTVMGGLRAEAWDLDTQDVNAQTRGHVSYLKINPSLFATYVLSPKRKLRFSYSHHQHRPDPSLLNPHLVYNSTTSVTLGNPSLKPQENDTIEAAYEYEDKALTYAVRGFYRRDDDLIAGTSFFIPDPQNLGNQVLETTHENYGFQTADGLTGNYNDRLNDHLTLSGDATLTFSAIRNPEITGAQQGTSLGGSESLTYVFADKDQFYVNYKLTGKSFSGQGYTDAYSVTSLQYKHELTPKLDLVMAVNDLLRTAKTESITQTPLVHSFSLSSRAAPTFYVALTLHFSHVAAVSPTS
jgi:outer membrane receptor protein involved in Fe transport